MKLTVSIEAKIRFNRAANKCYEGTTAAERRLELMGNLCVAAAEKCAEGFGYTLAVAGTCVGGPKAGAGGLVVGYCLGAVTGGCVGFVSGYMACDYLEGACERGAEQDHILDQEACDIELAACVVEGI